MRVGLPASTGALVTAAEKLGAPVLISANSLWEPKTGTFRTPGVRLGELDAALDSAGFVAMHRYKGYPWSSVQYAELASVWGWTWWAQQDLCCEPEIAANDAEIEERIKGTRDLLLQNLAQTIAWREKGVDWMTDPMPVLQGWRPEQYLRSMDNASVVLNVLQTPWPRLVGVGSVCRRPLQGKNGILAVLKVLDAELPDHTKLHLFGVKGTALPALREHPRVCSIDSMAWDFGARMDARKKAEATTMDRRCKALEGWYRRNVVGAGQLLPELRELLNQMPRALATWTRANPDEANARLLALQKV